MSCDLCVECGNHLGFVIYFSSHLLSYCFGPWHEYWLEFQSHVDHYPTPLRVHSAVQINIKGQIRLSRRAVLLEDGASLPSSSADGAQGRDGLNGTTKDPSKPLTVGSGNAVGNEQRRRRDVTDTKKFIRKD